MLVLSPDCHTQSKSSLTSVNIPDVIIRLLSSDYANITGITNIQIFVTCVVGESQSLGGWYPGCSTAFVTASFIAGDAVYEYYKVK